MIQFSFNNGPQIPLLVSGNVLKVSTDPAGENMPPLHLIVSGALTVNASAFTHEGALIVHPFRAIVDCPDCGAVLEVCEDSKGKTRGADGTQAATATFMCHGDSGDRAPLSEGGHVRVWGIPLAEKKPRILREYRGSDWTPELAGAVLDELSRERTTAVSVQELTVRNL